MGRVLASATVDVLRPAKPPSMGQFHVEVWGQPPHDFARVYKIQARSEDHAAREGIDRFVEEMEALELPDDASTC